ncbi:alpha/beta hydrolase family protein [Nocardia bovistercoris]|uniref:Alpha/beta hydrolase n=1 Tax=Nocardia bovistercoris TaxID=2785916 RepID=A0A931N412_9NOCA|nr:alpha/beta hydrolase [Nocardia bovistercoris]MBH0777771.1 hypothetical protein [Nocardia bovistercoris]
MNVLTLGPTASRRTVLFAAGGGGDPERHLPLLESLAADGCRVVAPYFERLTAPEPSTTELLARPLGLVEALDRESAPDAEVTAIGHSIGGWAVLCLAGAVPRGRDGRPFEVPREPRIGGLVLYTPAAGWFAAPDALEAITVPMLVFAGELDTVTPVEQAIHLTSAPAPVDLRVVPKAGHFSFMHTPPPGIPENVALDRDHLLTELTRATVAFTATSRRLPDSQNS